MRITIYLTNLVSMVSTLDVRLQAKVQVQVELDGAVGGRAVAGLRS